MQMNQSNIRVHMYIVDIYMYAGVYYKGNQEHLFFMMLSWHHCLWFIMYLLSWLWAPDIDLIYEYFWSRISRHPAPTLIEKSSYFYDNKHLWGKQKRAFTKGVNWLPLLNFHRLLHFQNLITKYSFIDSFNLRLLIILIPNLLNTQFISTFKPNRANFPPSTDLK